MHNIIFCKSRLLILNFFKCDLRSPGELTLNIYKYKNTLPIYIYIYLDRAPITKKRHVLLAYMSYSWGPGLKVRIARGVATGNCHSIIWGCQWSWCPTSAVAVARLSSERCCGSRRRPRHWQAYRIAAQSWRAQHACIGPIMLCCTVFLLTYISYINHIIYLYRSIHRI